jgi:hypothetical protein
MSVPATYRDGTEYGCGTGIGLVFRGIEGFGEGLADGEGYSDESGDGYGTSLGRGYLKNTGNS